VAVDGDTPLFRDRAVRVCPVHVDGAATQSCITPVDSVGKSAITRIEVVGNTSVTPRPMAVAWREQ
jgi:isoquinoline 1-oxidoreductase subunit alpha